jgi:hypothetical protein
LKNRSKIKGLLDGYREIPSLRQAIEVAGQGRRPDGKKFPHARRIPTAVLNVFAGNLLGRAREIAVCRSFDDLLWSVGDSRVRGIGDLTVYDTALHIGAKLGVLPTNVHLHAGTRTGARRLGLDVSRGCLTMPELPEPLKRLQAYEVEDFLCICKDYFSGRCRRERREADNRSC